MINYLTFMLTIAGIYAMLGLGLVTLWGQGGMVNLGLAGFFAVGAYASALLTNAGAPIALGWLAAAAFAGLVGAVLTFVTRRMSGDYLAIVSLGFAEVIRLAATNETWLTRGSDGISGIRAPYKAALGDLFGVSYLLLVWATIALVAWGLTRLLRSPYGRAMRAVRDDEQVAAVAGKPTVPLKLKTFGLGAGISGLAGAVYAHLTSFIAPDGFVPLLTIYIFLAVTLGGYTRVKGAIVGALLLVLLLESTRFLGGLIPGLNAVQVASLREIVIAGTLIAVMQWRPQGLLTEKNDLCAGRPPAPAPAPDGNGALAEAKP
ncbi:MAG: branched-chain amino acid ABC transporter permease [Rubrivivax sp.]